MAQGYWFKLSFKDSAEYKKAKAAFLTDKEGNFLYGIQEITAKRLRKKAIFDKEGIELTPEGLQKDFAVDLISDVGLDVLKELNKYVIEERENYQIGIGSFVGELVVKKKEKK